ncbi:MAG: PPC domain-containing protein [Pirellulales bacterium]
MARYFLATLLLAGVAATANGQLLSYPDPCLDFVYPAGGQQGTTVPVELGGPNGLAGATEVIVEGPPGVTVSEVKAANFDDTRAVLTIAPDAPSGRRRVRVAGGANGLTNYRYFFVGQLPEVTDNDQNNTPETAQQVSTPAVINGRIHPALDVDCYQFQGTRGQSLVAAILAHGMDSKLRVSFNLGFIDTSLELLDPSGKVIATGEDEMGLDPVLRCTLPADGGYTIRVASLGYKGSRTAVYRLTLGDVPYPTNLFPAGGQRGTTVDVELQGPNVPPGTRQPVEVSTDSYPWQDVSLDNPLAGRHELPFVRGDHPETLEVEPNDAAAQALPLAVPSTANGRFLTAGDEDWYRLSLKAAAGVILQTTAQRLIRSPLDTVIEVFDAAGKKLAENDDGNLLAGQTHHDFAAADSWLTFTAPTDGDYFVRVRDQTGAAGPQAVYRLTVEPLVPDFQLFHWPDAVPVWGPGTSSVFVVQLFHWGGITNDVQIRVEGLPPGWKASAANFAHNYFGIYSAPANSYGAQILVTLTAPEDAPIGTIVPFQVVGTCQQEGQTIERVAQAQTLYGNSHNDRMFLRDSPGAMAVVAKPMDCRIDTAVTELSVVQGGTVEIPIRVTRSPDAKGDIGIGVDGPTVAAGTGWRPPLTLKPDQSDMIVPLAVSAEWKPGLYGIVVSRSWSADLRAGRPGPCTPLIQLRINPPAAK